MPLDINLCLAKIEHNRITYIQQQEEEKFDITKYEWADISSSEVDLVKALSKQADLAAAVQVGVLPFYNERHGADGIKILGNLVILVELKSTWISPDKIWQTENGTLYTGKPGKNSKTSVESAAEGKWSKLTLASVAGKKLLTYLVWFESKPGNKFFQVIDAWSLPGDYVFAKLSDSIKKNYKTAQIKASEFRIHGDVVSCIVPAKGLDVWKKEMRLTVPVYLTENGKKKMNAKNSPSPTSDSALPTKTDPTEQISTPCSLVISRPQTRDLQETPPISLCD